MRERSARDAKLGLWQHAAYAVLDATKPAEILRHRAELVVVEGRVLRATERSGRLYIDFGERWQDDFTVVVPPRVLRETDKSQTATADTTRSSSTTGAVTVDSAAGNETASKPKDPSAQRREAGSAAPPLRNLAGHIARVRGWIDYRNGPAIELATTEQVELVE